MSLELANFIIQLVATNPEGTDPKSQGDDHLRVIKSVLKNQFSGFTQGIPITRTESEINSMLLAGAFGLGGPAITINEGLINTADLASGFYYVNAQAAGFLPVQINSYMLYVDNPVAGFAWRLIAPHDNGTLYSQVKVNGVWNAARLFRDVINTPGQTSLVDTGGAAILTPGSFGVGVTMSATANADLNWGPYAKVGYNGKWLGASWVNCPAGEQASPAVLELKTYSADWSQQTFTSILTRATFQRFWYNGTTWSPWERLLPAGLFLKAQNGYQVIDGIMRQWGMFAAGLSPNTSGLISFPTAFSAPWTVNANCQAWSGSNIYGLNVTQINAANFGVGYYTNTGSNSGAIFWQAVGLP